MLPLKLDKATLRQQDMATDSGRVNVGILDHVIMMSLEHSSGPRHSNIWHHQRIYHLSPLGWLIPHQLNVLRAGTFSIWQEADLPSVAKSSLLATNMEPDAF